MSMWPRMLYRDGNEYHVWDRHHVATRIVNSEEEESEALANGWRLTPDRKDPFDHDGDGRPGGSIDKWDQFSDEALRAEIESRGISLHHRAGRTKMLQILREQ